MPLTVTALYAGLLGLIYIVLTGLVGQNRGRVGVALGQGGDKALIEADRRQLNFVESVPLALALIAILELNGAGKTFLHLLGAVLVLARLVHPFGITTETMVKPARIAGAFGTLAVLLVAALALLRQALFG